ncbi:sporulation-specific Sps2p [Fusarium pseudoanthophilum]|uniref:Sporulation-specific Sps2p n=1 Tax=Fusarium pseudoanthophilum TaxID=48495 RepID=A0A8H5NQK5_9HYPO|nr:sporulation-specific Sps2p [Fusarium pseudoanthophilum]
MAPTSRIAFLALSFLLSGHFAAAECDISGNYTIIAAPDDQDGVQSCKDVDGSMSLLFDKDPSSWPSDKATVDLGDISSLTGDLVIYPHHDSKKTVVTASSLKTIEGALTIWNTGTGKDHTIEEFDLVFDALEEVGKDYVITEAFAKLSLEHKADITVGGMARVYDTDVEELQLNGVYTVNGDFSIDSNSDMKELDVPALTYANKGLIVKGNNALEKVSFGKLKSVKGNMQFNQNGALQTIYLAALESAATMAITANGNDATVLLPWLSSIGNSTTTATSDFSGLGKIEFSSLRTVNGSLTFESNSFEDLTIPLIKEMNGAITVEDNPSLTTFALPRVTYVDELDISSNDKLTNITANALKTAGTIAIKGSFTNVEFFNLKKVTGDFKVSGDESMDCSWFDANIKSIVEGKYTCVGDHDKKERKPSTGGIEDTEGNPKDYMTSPDEEGGNGGSGGGSSGSGNDSGSGSGSSDGGKEGSKGGLSTGAKAGIGIGVAIIVVLLIVGAVMFWLWRRRQTAAPGEKRLGSSGSGSTKKGIFDGQQMGVQTKIEATNPSPSPSIGTLNFGRNSLIESTGGFTEKSLNAWKTIRRVSVSSGGSSTVKEGTSILKG